MSLGTAGAEPGAPQPHLPRNARSSSRKGSAGSSRSKGSKGSKLAAPGRLASTRRGVVDQTDQMSAGVGQLGLGGGDREERREERREDSRRQRLQLQETKRQQRRAHQVPNSLKHAPQMLEIRSILTQQAQAIRFECSSSFILHPWPLCWQDARLERRHGHLERELELRQFERLSSGPLAGTCSRHRTSQVQINPHLQHAQHARTGTAFGEGAAEVAAESDPRRHSRGRRGSQQGYLHRGRARNV